jgi:hypothetical protein
LQDFRKQKMIIGFYHRLTIFSSIQSFAAYATTGSYFCPSRQKARFSPKSAKNALVRLNRSAPPSKPLGGGEKNQWK